MATDAAPVWPSAVLGRKVLAQGYTRSWQDGVQSTSMEKGVPKTRQRTASAYEPVQCAIMANIGKLARMRRFFREETHGGADPFWLPDQIMDGQPLATAGGRFLTTAGGAPLTISAHWLVMFTPGSPPQEGDNQGAWFRISFSLLILP